MWMFNLDGFFSTVAVRNEPGKVMVRARKRDDIVRAGSKMGALKAHYTPKNDYPYRVIVSREVFSKYVQKSIAELTYTNFKNAALEAADRDTRDKYHDVWAVMAGYY